MQQKGSAIRGTLRALRAMHGDAAVTAVMARVPPEVRRQLEPVVLASNWYPIETIAAVHLAIRDAIGNGNWDVSRALGAAASREDWGGIHRVFMSALDLDLVFSRSQASWNRYHTQGRVVWTEQERGSARGVIDEVSGFNEGVWNAVAGRVQTMFELLGARAAIVDLAHPGPTQCHFQVTWLE